MWFIYDQVQKTFSPYIEFQTAPVRYVLVYPEDGVSIPSGYAPVEVELQGQKVTAYTNGKQEDFLLLYAMNINGETGFYFYDKIEGTFQRYTEPEIIIQEPEPAEPDEPETPGVTENEKIRNLRVILYVLSGISIMLLGLTIAMSIIIKKKMT